MDFDFDDITVLADGIITFSAGEKNVKLLDSQSYIFDVEPLVVTDITSLSKY